MGMLNMAPRGIQRYLSILLTKRALNQVSHVVAVGEGWRSSFVKRWNFSPDKMTVVENGSEIVNMVDRDRLRAFSTSVSSEVLTVVYVGAFEPWHGLPILVDAVASAISKGIALRLILIGAGSQDVVIKQMIIDLGIKDHVVFAGQLSPREFAPYLASADIGVSPYCGRAEYSGLKLLDYKSAGLAVIASGENGQPAVLKHGVTGWVIPPCNKDALCDAIVHLSANPDLRRRIGKQARLDAEMYHSWKHTAEQLEQLFNKVIMTSSV
jgi:glycosyltransferase involved in cell wall biosynthesis